MPGGPATIADPATRAAFYEYVLRAADDELIIGHRHSEWTGFGPDIESDVAFSSIAQEEIGHARVFYGQLASGEGDADRLAYSRRPPEYRHAIFVERENGGWESSIVRLALYERYDAERLRLLAASGQDPVAGLARALLREERYHVLYADTWLSRLVQGGPAARDRVQRAVDNAWPEALGLFERTDADGRLEAAGLLTTTTADIRRAWETTVRALLDSCGLSVPGLPAHEGGRNGTHTDEFDRLHAQMTEVWRSDPEARW